MQPIILWSLLDEIQHVPDLMPYIQVAVDETSTPGKFILTGSQNFLLMGKVAQTLAGRTGILNLLLFSRAELEAQQQDSPSVPLLNFSNLAYDCGISVDTARRWVSILNTGFILFLLPPHHRNFNKRVIKSPRLYFYDTGLLCHLLGIRKSAQLYAHPLRGAVFENYAIAEVAKSFFHHRRTPPIYFWRDRTGHEIDLLIEEAGELFAVEVKSGQTISTDMLNSLRWWLNLSGLPPENALLVYGGDERQTRHGIAICPWYAI